MANFDSAVALARKRLAKSFVCSADYRVCYQGIFLLCCSTQRGATTTSVSTDNSTTVCTDNCCYFLDRQLLLLLSGPIITTTVCTDTHRHLIAVPAGRYRSRCLLSRRRRYTFHPYHVDVDIFHPMCCTSAYTMYVLSQSAYTMYYVMRVCIYIYWVCVCVCVCVYHVDIFHTMCCTKCICYVLHKSAYAMYYTRRYFYNSC